MSKTTRISAAIASQLSPTAGFVESYYMDGRVVNLRNRFTELVIDREQSSSCYALYGTRIYQQNFARTIELANDLMRRLSILIGAAVNEKVDEYSPDLFQTAWELTSLDATAPTDSGEQPWFSGFIVLNGGISALTMGDGVALLYRDDILYPLTKSNFRIQPYDYHNNTVDNIDYYTFDGHRIAKHSQTFLLKPNDRVILGRGKVFSQIGQKDLLKIAHEAFDESEVINDYLGILDNRAPDLPVQIAVANIMPMAVPQRSWRGITLGGLGRANQDMIRAVAEATAGAEEATSANMGAGADLSESYGFPAPLPVESPVDPGYVFNPDDLFRAAESGVGEADRAVDAPGAGAVDHVGTPENYPKLMIPDLARRPAESTVPDLATGSYRPLTDMEPEADDTSYDDSIYSADGYYDDDDEYDFSYDKDDPPADYDTHERRPGHRMAIYTLGIVLVAVIVLIIYSLFNRGGGTPGGTDGSTTTTEQPMESTTVEITETTEPPVETTVPEASTTAPVTSEVVIHPTIHEAGGIAWPQEQTVYHVTKRGDNLWAITKYYYGSRRASERYYQIIRQANPLLFPDGSNNVGVGWTIVIPDPATASTG
ncbi:MAG: hypothetical protein GX907_01005 [Clostridiaceae bacterium]|nr:hypothetical protein [Clostridiaceae bacterium]